MSTSASVSKPFLMSSASMQTLPDEVFQYLVEYLDRPSQVFLAVSKTCSMTQGSGILLMSMSLSSSSIIPSTVDLSTLDMDHFGFEVTHKITDEDLAALIRILNAKEHVKVLKISSCRNVIGSGLEPLRNSTFLREIHLPKLIYGDESEAAVIPILRSMLPPHVSADASSLLVIHYPGDWLVERRRMFAEFLELFDSVLTRRKYRCNHCNSWCPRSHSSNQSKRIAMSCSDELYAAGYEGGASIDQRSMYGYGKAKFVCTRCAKVFCNQRELGCHNYCGIYISLCSTCDMLACAGCATFKTRKVCNKLYCEECSGRCYDEKCKRCEDDLWENQNGYEEYYFEDYEEHCTYGHFTYGFIWKFLGLRRGDFENGTNIFIVKDTAWGFRGVQGSSWWKVTIWWLSQSWIGHDSWQE